MDFIDNPLMEARKVLVTYFTAASPSPALTVDSSRRKEGGRGLRTADNGGPVQVHFLPLPPPLHDDLERPRSLIRQILERRRTLIEINTARARSRQEIYLTQGRGKLVVHGRTP